MTIKAEEIISIAIDEVNDDAGGILIAKHPATILLGSESTVDSLSLVRLLVTIERLIEEKTAKSIVIVDESMFESAESPFASVQSLTEYIRRLILT